MKPNLNQCGFQSPEMLFDLIYWAKGCVCSKSERSLLYGPHFLILLTLYSWTRGRGPYFWLWLNVFDGKTS